MKIKLAIFGVAVGVILSAGRAAATIYNGGLPSTTGAVPDGNLAGLTSAINLNTSGDNSVINGVELTLNISGGYNGDLYGYLVNPNGNTAMLLNRVGMGTGAPGTLQYVFGYSDAGLNLTLSDFATYNSIQTYQSSSPTYNLSGQLTGNWAPAAGDFSALQSGSANGTWTLFLADVSAGDQSMLVSWGLNISVVPEPVTWAMLIFGFVLGAIALGRKLLLPQSA